MYLYLQYLQGTETEQARNRAAYFRQFAAHLSVPVTGELGCGRMKSFADSSAVGVHWEQVDRYLQYLDYLNIYNTTHRTGRRPTTASWSPTRLPTPPSYRGTTSSVSGTSSNWTSRVTRHYILYTLFIY